MSNPHPLRSSIAMSNDNWPSLTMCILVIALQCHPRFPFICAHNRDELLDSSECRVTKMVPNRVEIMMIARLWIIFHAWNMHAICLATWDIYCIWNMHEYMDLDHPHSSSRGFPWWACRYLLLFSIGKAKRSSFVGWSAGKVWFVVWTRRNGRWYRLRLAGGRSFRKSWKVGAHGIWLIRQISFPFLQLFHVIFIFIILPLIFPSTIIYILMGNCLSPVVRQKHYCAQNDRSLLAPFVHWPTVEPQ